MHPSLTPALGQGIDLSNLVAVAVTDVAKAHHSALEAMALPIGHGTPVKEVRLKFNFTNLNRVPQGIKERPRHLDKFIDRQHAQGATQHGKAELGEIGRLRPGRVDTGNQVVNNLPNVQVALIRKGLAATGLLLADAYYQNHRQQGRADKWVVNLVFRTSDQVEQIKPLDRAALDGARALANTTWSYCHVFANPDGTATVNMVGLNPDHKPKHALVVRGRKIIPIAVNRGAEEEEE